ncbi:MAG: hypothetical protein AABW47_03825 [Nanoarchaeota archaeon]
MSLTLTSRLTDKEKEEFKQKGREHKTVVDGVILPTIEKYLIEVRRLRQKIEDTRPKTPNGELPCDGCGNQSMRYLKNKNDYKLYECEVCGKKSAYEIK